MPSSSFWINASIDVLLVVYVLDCVFMGLVIMMQRSKQEGLGAAFGGGFTESIWGAQTSQVLVKATVWAAALFFILSITLAKLYASRASLNQQASPVQLELEKAAATNAAPATPATNAAPVMAPATNEAVAPAASAPVSATNAPAKKSPSQ